MHCATFADVAAHLDRLGLFHMDFGLQRMHLALDALRLTRQGGLTRPVVQIVGTNGKGSTAHFLASIAERHGLRVGLYTSPHLVDVTERIRLDGRPLPREDWPELANAVYAVCPELTYFEFLTVLAVLAFNRAGVDLLILEAGLGGRHDATTAVDADLVCFTPIGLDHLDVLGPDLASIAADKAGAMRPGLPAITVRQEQEAMTCLEAASWEVQCPLWQAIPVLPDTVLGLCGPHQRINAGLALDAWRLLAGFYDWDSQEETILQGLAQAFIPGRMQRVELDGLPLILDGSHNEHGLNALLEALTDADLHPRAVIFTYMADKQVEALTDMVRGLEVPVFVPVLPGNSRAAAPEDLAARLGDQARPCADMRAALAGAGSVATGSGPVLICGSLYLVGEFFRLHPCFLEASSAGNA